ncbi:MAG: hypothetical protein JHC93_08190 [Parachlamydiales bacterium]|nr:hypothetical protein [Parachlamydiales bacterium]
MAHIFQIHNHRPSESFLPFPTTEDLNVIEPSGVEAILYAHGSYGLSTIIKVAKSFARISETIEIDFKYQNRQFTIKNSEPFDSNLIEDTLKKNKYQLGEIKAEFFNGLRTFKLI